MLFNCFAMYCTIHNVECDLHLHLFKIFCLVLKLALCQASSFNTKQKTRSGNWSVNLKSDHFGHNTVIAGMFRHYNFHSSIKWWYDFFHALNSGSAKRVVQLVVKNNKRQWYWLVWYQWIAMILLYSVIPNRHQYPPMSGSYDVITKPTLSKIVYLCMGLL